MGKRKRAYIYVKRNYFKNVHRQASLLANFWLSRSLLEILKNTSTQNTCCIHRVGHNCQCSQADPHIELFHCHLVEPLSLMAWPGIRIKIKGSFSHAFRAQLKEKARVSSPAGLTVAGVLCTTSKPKPGHNICILIKNENRPEVWRMEPEKEARG